MNDSDLIYLADLNLAESLREIARWRVSSEIIEQDDLLLVSGGDSTPMTNSVIRVGDRPYPPAEEVMNRIKRLFRQQEFRLQCAHSPASRFRS